MTVTVRAEEPGVDPETEVRPAYLPERETWRFRICPRDIQQWIESQVPHQRSPFVRQSEFDASCAPSAKGPGHAMLRRPYTAQVKELRYPGRPQDVEDPTGKWVYAFREGKLQAEATCVESGTWDNWAVHGALRRPSGNARGVQVDPGPKGQRYKYSYLLSPVRLSQSVLDGIDTARLASAAVECACDRFEKAIYVPDPLRWACEVNERFYLPRLNTLSGWIYDANMAASDFIARVLKKWIDAGDAAGIKNQLHRQPDSWLDARRTGMARATEAAEEAAAYLAHCVTSVEYLAVSRRAWRRGKRRSSSRRYAWRRRPEAFFRQFPGGSSRPAFSETSVGFRGRSSSTMIARCSRRRRLRGSGLANGRSWGSSLSCIRPGTTSGRARRRPRCRRTRPPSTS
jgi:hypothetical protein